MNQKARILIIEDEKAILRGLTDLFVFHGYDVDSAGEGPDGLEKALRGGYDLLILDIMLPGLDGYSICNRIREVDRSLPIIMVTARTSDDDIITGLTLGADDYIAKPFSVQELILRVQAVLRRAKGLEDGDERLKIGSDLEIDCRNLTAPRPGKDGGSPIEFTRREIEILRYLKRNQTRPVSRGELLAEVWGYAKSASIETRTVDIHIAKLRRKIELNPKEPKYLVTIRGEGYKLLPSA